MKSKARFLVAILCCASGCAGTGAHQSRKANENPAFNESHPGAALPNMYGWDHSNCAHIMADGHCAHPIGFNPMAPAATPDEPITPTPLIIPSHGYDSSNCAHIMADGSCAHPL